MSDEETIRAALEPLAQALHSDAGLDDWEGLAWIPTVRDWRNAVRALSALTRLVAERDAAEEKGWNSAIEAAKNRCLAGKTMTTEDQDGHLRWHHGVEMNAVECATAIAALRKETQ